MRNMQRNMFTRIIATVLALIWGAAAYGLTIHTEAGGLQAAIGKNTDATELSVTGTLNLADFEFMALEMKNLRKLDMSEATVAAYKGEPTFTGRTSSRAGMFPDYALLGLPLTEVTLPKGINAIGDGALAGLAIKAITIPASVTSIGNRAFSGCRNLENISLPASVSSIGEGAFKECASLRGITIAGSPDAIAPYTFQGCAALAGIQLPKSVKSVGKSAFNGCVSLAAINFPAGITRIEELAFNGTALTAANMAGCTAMTSVGDWAFAGCTALTTVTFPRSLTHIGTGAFFRNSSLTDAAIPSKVKRIPDFAFTGAAGDGDMIRESAVESIGKYALADWRAVKVFSLPAPLSEIEEGGMAGWTAPDSIKAGRLAVVPGLGPDVWGDLDKHAVVLSVRSSLKDEFENTPQWEDFNIAVEKSDTVNSIHTVIPDTPSIKAYFDGMTLMLRADAPIAAAQLYDIDGRSYILPRSESDGGASMDIDTSAMDAKVMIVRVLLADGSAVSLKLYR